MYCRHCGRSIPDDSRFCPRCGGSLHAQKRPPRPQAQEDHDRARPVPASPTAGATDDARCGRSLIGQHLDNGAVYGFIQSRLDRIEKFNNEDEEKKNNCEEKEGLFVNNMGAVTNGQPPPRISLGAVILMVLIASLVVIAAVIVFAGGPKEGPPPRLEITDSEVNVADYKLFQDPITHKVTSGIITYDVKVVVGNQDDMEVSLVDARIECVVRVDNETKSKEVCNPVKDTLLPGTSTYGVATLQTPEIPENTTFYLVFFLLYKGKCIDTEIVEKSF